MEDDIDIYEDLPSFGTKECQANKELTEECSKLREENTKLREDVVKLGVNISSLMKTAKAEIARKDKMITQLRQELDNAAFRRGNYGVRRKQNVNIHKFKKVAQNTEKTEQTSAVKAEALQENAATELDDISDMEDMGDVEHSATTDYQDKLTSTVFGARLKNKLRLEQEAERIKKELAQIPVSAMPINVEKVEDRGLASGNGFVKKENLSVVLEDTVNVQTEEKEIPVVSSLPHSSNRFSPLHQEDDNPCHRQAPKRNVSETGDFSADSEQPKRRRVEEERCSREEDAREHHNGNFKYDDVRYNSDGVETSAYSKTSTKYTDPRRARYNRDDSDRAHHKVRERRSKSTYRSNGIAPRYNERRPDRHTMEESRARYDKYDKQRENGWSREGDNKRSEYSRQIDELRDKIEGKVGGRSEYISYTSHRQVEWNLKRLGCKSRSPEKCRSHSGSRGSREMEFDKRQSKRSRSSDKFINAKSTVDEHESSKEHQSTRGKNSKDSKVELGNNRDAQPEDSPDFSRNDPPNKAAINKISNEITENGSPLCTERPNHVDTENATSTKVTLKKLVRQKETPNERIATLKNNSEVSSMQSAIPQPAAPGSGSFRKEKRREDGWNRDGDNNWSEDSRKIDDLRGKIESKVGGRSEYNNCNSHHHLDSNLKRVGRKSRSPEKYKSHSDRRKSREKEFDKRQSKRSTSTDKCIDAKSTVDERQSGKERQSTRIKDIKDSKDIKVEVRRSPDAQPEVPPDFSPNDPPNKVVSGKMSSSGIAENGLPMCTEEPGHVNIENAESAGLTLEKLPSQVESPDERVSALENDSDAALIQPSMPESTVFGSGSSRDKNRREGDNNCIEYSRENDELCDKFESDVCNSSEGNNCNSSKRLDNKSRSPDKHQSHSDIRRSREKEVDKRRSRRSRSTDKCINAKNTMDEGECGNKRQSTPIKDSKDIEVDVKNSCNAQPEILPNCSKNEPPKEVAIHKISPNEIAENGLPKCTEEPRHVDIENAKSAGITLEKLLSQVETPDERIAALGNDSKAASIQPPMPESTTFGSESSREEKRRDGDNNCIEYRKENDELRDKFESDVGGSSEGNNYNILNRLGHKSRSPEKHRSRSDSRRSREQEVDKRRSKRSRSTDKCINAKSTVDERESGKKRQSTRAKDSKDLEVDVRNSSDAQPEVPPDLSNNSPANEVAIDKISATEVDKNCLPLSTAEPDHADIENTESVRVTLENIVTQVETSDRWIADLENDSDVSSIQSETPESAAPGSRSFREEKIENIEKFIKDYQENEESCLPIANRESEEREKLGDSTSSIVDTLSMDVEESVADEKSDNVSKNPPEEPRTDIKDVAGDTERKISKPDMLTDQCATSVQLKTLEDKEIPITPEISDKKQIREKHLTNKAAALKLTKGRPRIPCPPIISRYSKMNPLVLADCVSSNCVVKSQSSTNTEEDHKSKKEIKTRRIPTEEPSVQLNESSAKESDSKIFIPKQQIEDANIVTSKNANAARPETKNTTDDSRTRKEADCRAENSENNSVSVSSSGNNIIHQAETSPELPAEADAAPKSNNIQEPVELRETRLIQKTTPAAVPSTDSKLSNRKKALPKEGDSRAKPVAKQHRIIVNARRRPVQLGDSCIVRTLVPSVHDVTWNESVKTVCGKAEGAELPKLVSGPAIRGRKRRLIDK